MEQIELRIAMGGAASLRVQSEELTNLLCLLLASKMRGKYHDGGLPSWVSAGLEDGSLTSKAALGWPRALAQGGLVGHSRIAGRVAGRLALKAVPEQAAVP